MMGKSRLKQSGHVAQNPKKQAIPIEWVVHTFPIANAPACTMPSNGWSRTRAITHCLEQLPYKCLHEGGSGSLPREWGPTGPGSRGGGTDPCSWELYILKWLSDQSLLTAGHLSHPTGAPPSLAVSLWTGSTSRRLACWTKAWRSMEARMWSLASGWVEFLPQGRAQFPWEDEWVRLVV